MENKLFKYIVVAVVAMILSYFLIAYANWEISPKKWTVDARILNVMLCVVLATVGLNLPEQKK